jgi:uncharacterized protein YjbI with pentapeptide repeats
MIIDGHEIKPYANLNGADLSGADLRGADLIVANLIGADLTKADLSGADLSGAYLTRANLSGADLSGADLSGAYLYGAILPNGKTLKEYISWLPSGLLTQGGKLLGDVVASWDKHTWEGCPMAKAFGVNALEKVPECWRQEASLFVALFDGKHLPKPGAEAT